MNYQYNQQPQPQYQPQASYNPAAENAKKKAAFEAFADKFADFCKTHSFLAVLASYSDFITYALAGFSLLMGILLVFIGGNTIVPLCYLTLFFAVLSLSKKNLLPFAIAVSYISLMQLISLILLLVSLINPYVFSVGLVLCLIFSIVEVAMFSFITVVSWMYFVAMLPPRVYQPQPMYNNQMPPQQGGYHQPPMQQTPPPPPAPAPMQQTPPPPPPAPAPMQQPQPQPHAGPKVCPACGMANDPDSGFCRGCGAKI